MKHVKLSDRVTAFTKFITLLQKLFELNNYNGVNEILSGINSAPVRRLKNTWEVSIILIYYNNNYNNIF